MNQHCHAVHSFPIFLFYFVADSEINSQKLKHCNGNTYALLVYSKLFGLEVNAEETTVYVRIS